MAYHPPPMPPNPNWQPAPQFIPDSDFGVVPNFGASTPPAEAFGPPDPLATLRADLDALIRACVLGPRQGLAAWAGRSTVAHANGLIDTVAALGAREPLARLPAPRLCTLPELVGPLRAARDALGELERARAMRPLARVMAMCNTSPA